jgi:hypothetical protein
MLVILTRKPWKIQTLWSGFPMVIAVILFFYHSKPRLFCPVFKWLLNIAPFYSRTQMVHLNTRQNSPDFEWLITRWLPVFRRPLYLPSKEITNQKLPRQWLVSEKLDITGFRIVTELTVGQRAWFLEQLQPIQGPQLPEQHLCSLAAWKRRLVRASFKNCTWSCLS